MAGMVTDFDFAVFFNGSLLSLGLSAADYVILLLALCLVFFVSLWQERGVAVREKIAAQAGPVRVLIWYGLFLCVLLFGAYGIGYDASQFIYNQF